MGGGYVCDFSDRTFAEFFEDEFRIEIYGGAYEGHGGSKAKHLRAFIEVEDAALVARVLRSLADYEATRPLVYGSNQAEKDARLSQVRQISARLEADAPLASTIGIDRFVRDETLEELVTAIERDIQADRPEVAIGHLHTYCMKKFGHLLDVRGIAWSREEPLHSRVGKYRKAIDEELATHEMTRTAIRNSTNLFQLFNDVRNNRSLAHDNAILERAEARFVFDSVVAVLRFVKAIEAGQFE